ncbi:MULTISPECIES: hypothetical protein [Mumia]|uniref:hypothetical protein n=1 Tax=Mumia TaxID=1546255 RepID=UPI00141ED29D|nr:MULTISPECIES: hypothetical protein [unclassified Mumia]QMW65501.1 hypothetical protein H4N58_15045 [Mumia sp. ZJ1417]
MSAPFLVDLASDAASLVEGAPPLTDVIAAHVARRTAAGDVVDVLGPLVVSDTALPSVQGVVDSLGTDPLDVVVTVTGGAGAIEPAVRWAVRQPGIRLRGLVAAVRDLDDLTRGAHRVAAMVSQLDAEGLLDEVRVDVSLPLYARTEGSSRWQHALDTLAMEDLHLLLRTGGADADDTPSPETLAGAIGDALDREVAFSCAGDLAHAVAWREPDTSRVRHGVLNILLATRASLDGANATDIAERLTIADPERVVADLGIIGEAGLQSARRWFAGVASDDVDATLADLRTLALLP